MKAQKRHNSRQSHNASLGNEITAMRQVVPNERILKKSEKRSFDENYINNNDENRVSGLQRNNAQYFKIEDNDNLEEIVDFDNDEAINAKEEIMKHEVVMEEENNERNFGDNIQTSITQKANQDNYRNYFTGDEENNDINNQNDMADVDAMNLFDNVAFDPLIEQNLKTLANTIEKNLSNEKIESGDKSKTIKTDQKSYHDIIISRLKQDSAIYNNIRECSKILAEYRSGLVPKILKMIAASSLWQPILELTEPQNWTPHATLAMTRLFVAMLPERPASVFLADILMPRIYKELERQPVQKSNSASRVSTKKQTKPGKLPIQLFEALGKATWRPVAFFKGVVFPLIDENANSTVVRCVTSVLKRWSVPSKYSAPAISRLARMVTKQDPEEPFEWSQNACAFIGSLLDKGYSLPATTLNDCIEYFYRIAFSTSKAQSLPLVYHYTMLIFVKRYASALRGDQQVKLLDITKRQRHEGGITDEIMRVIKESGQQNDNFSLDRVAI